MSDRLSALLKRFELHARVFYSGALCGISNPQLAQAISALHADPARTWTLTASIWFCLTWGVAAQTSDLTLKLTKPQTDKPSSKKQTSRS